MHLRKGLTPLSRASSTSPVAHNRGFHLRQLPPHKAKSIADPPGRLQTPAVPGRTNQCGMARNTTRLLFWSTITAIFVRLSTSIANCDKLLIPRVCRVLKFCTSTTELLFDVELIVSSVPVW